MNPTDEPISALDPVCAAAVAAATARPVFAELVDAIVDGTYERAADGAPAVPSTAARRRGARGARRRTASRRVLAGAAVTSILLAVVLLTVQALTPTTPGRGGPAAVTHAAPRWQLVSSVGNWKSVSAPASDSAAFLALGSDPGGTIVCPTTSTCYTDNLLASSLAGSPGDTVTAVDVTTDGGRSWRSSDLPVDLVDPSDLSCATASDCAILGVAPSGSAALLVTSNAGVSWAAVAGPDGLTSGDAATALACATPTSCVIVAANPAAQTGVAVAYATSDGGATWTVASLPENVVPRDLQCVSTEQCFVTGSFQLPARGATIASGAVLFSTNGGVSWASGAAPSGLGPMSTSSCASATWCVASFFGDAGSASQILTSRDGGATWEAVSATGLPSGLVMGLSCPSTTQCWSSGLALAVGGRHGQGQITVTAPAKLSPADGAPPTPSGDIAVTSDGGQTWSETPLPTGVVLVVNVACPSATTCYAVGLKSGGTYAQAMGSNAQMANERFVLLKYGS